MPRSALGSASLSALGVLDVCQHLNSAPQTSLPMEYLPRHVVAIDDYLFILVGPN